MGKLNRKYSQYVGIAARALLLDSVLNYGSKVARPREHSQGESHVDTATRAQR